MVALAVVLLEGVVKGAAVAGRYLGRLGGARPAEVEGVGEDAQEADQAVQLTHPVLHRTLAPSGHTRDTSIAVAAAESPKGCLDSEHGRQSFSALLPACWALCFRGDVSRGLLWLRIRRHSFSALLPACRELCGQRSHLQGRPGEGPLVLGGERKHRARRGAAPVLDAVRLVEDHPPPPHLHSHQADLSRPPVRFLTVVTTGAGASRPRGTF